MFPNAQDYDDLRLTYKVPEEFDNETFVDYAVTFTNFSSAYTDEVGEHIPATELPEINFSDHVTVDTTNNTIDFNLSQMLNDYDLRLKKEYNDNAGEQFSSEVLVGKGEVED